MNTLIARTLVLLFLSAAALRAQDCWQERASGSFPANGFYNTAVWTGSEMIVWGGTWASISNTGGRYNPEENSWTTVSDIDAPPVRTAHTAVWTGSEMIVWGGWNGTDVLNDGRRYNPATNSWSAVSTTGAPTARRYHTAVWTGSEMIVWGGVLGTGTSPYLNTGGRYNPATNSWTAVTTTTGAPAARGYHTAVWTGSEMIVWGGSRASPINTGGRYNPAGDTWTAVSLTGAPSARDYHTAVWTGSEMIVWGGTFLSYLNDGGRYNPAGDTWTAVSTAGAPARRIRHTAVWTGSDMIVWGGDGAGTPTYTGLNDGGRYSPAGNSWTAVSTTGAPPARSGHTAVWTGSQMIVWGGRGPENLNDTFSYMPDCGTFRITSVVLDSGNLVLSFPTVTGSLYTLWQSDTMGEGTWTITDLPAVVGTGATLTFTVPVTIPGRGFFRVQADL